MWKPTESGVKTLLYFEAVDWNTTVYINGKNVGNHVGGYDSFSFDITNHIDKTENEILVYVEDPSNYGE